MSNGSDTGKGGATVTAEYDIDVGYDIDTYGYGWGAGAWSRLGWGSGAVTPVVLQQRDWFFNNFDNDLVMNIRNGPIYYWERSAGITSRAALLSATTINGVAPADVPTETTEILVYSGATTPSTITLADTVAGIGCIARDSIQGTGKDVLFLSNSGVRSFARTVIEKSVPIGDLSKNVRSDFMKATGMIATTSNLFKGVNDPKRLD